MSPSQTRRFVVIGGGIGGLVAATLLAQAGQNVTILERRKRYAETEFLEAGQGINLTKNVWTCFAALGMADDFMQISDFGKMCSVRNHSDGDIARTIDTLHGHRFVHRTDLLRLLFRYATTAGATVLQGETFVTLEESAEKVILLLQSGKKLEADLVIGADGVNSKTRSNISSAGNVSPRLTGDCTFLVDVSEAAMQKHESTLALYNSGTPPFHLWTAPGRSIVAWTMTRHKRYHLQMNDHAYGAGAAYGEDGTHGEAGFVERFTNMSAFRERWNDFEPAIKALLAETNAVTRWKIAELPDTPSWSSHTGRIVLLGDAAHAFPPYAGQGAAMAVEDATLLATLLCRNSGSQTMLEIGKAYEELRRPRILGFRDIIKRNVEQWASNKPALQNDIASKNEAVPEGAKGAWSTKERYIWIDEYDAVAEASSYHFEAKL